MLRVLLIAIAVYLVYKWIIGVFKVKGGGGMSARRGQNRDSAEDYISKMTDQEIDDVDFEEVDTEKKK